MTENNQPPSRAVADLQIFPTLAGAFALTCGRPLLLLRAALGGLVMLAVASMAYLILPNTLTALLATFAPLAAYSHLGVNIYRLVLLGPEGLVRPTLRWDSRHWHFFGYGVALGSASLLILLVVGTALPFLPGAVTAIVLWYLAARCSFLFAAIAVEEPYSLALSWRHTRGQGLRLTTCLLMAAIPLGLLAGLLVSVLAAMTLGDALSALAELGGAEAFTPQDEAAAAALEEILRSIPPATILALKMIFEALSMAILAVLFAIVAVAFRSCTGWVPATSGNLPTAPEDKGPEDKGPGDDGPQDGGPGGPWG